MKFLVLDNYDSFVYNLVHMLKELHADEICIRKNDQITLQEVEKFDKILLSPGPGIPNEAGILLDLIKKYSATKSILGICLGHQAIAESFGSDLINLPEPKHGISSEMRVLEEDYLFNGIPKEFAVGHYHSWVVNPIENSNLETIALDTNQNIMALRHKEFDVKGLQFHPESILTDFGLQIIKNWMTHKS